MVSKPLSRLLIRVGVGVFGMTLWREKPIEQSAGLRLCRKLVFNLFINPAGPYKRRVKSVNVVGLF